VPCSTRGARSATPPAERCACIFAPMRRIIALAVVALAPASALAQTPAAPTTAAAPPRAPTPLQQAILRGITAYRQQGWDAAAAAFRDAARLDGASPTPQLYLGCTAAARGDAASAQGFFREALRLATVGADDMNQARARIAMSTLLEAGASWDPARLEWEQFVRFADAHATTVPAGVGRARLDALMRRTAVAQESEPVRQRIEERLRVNATGANLSPPAGMVAVPPGTPPR